ncbi:MAG: hypothetical protein DRJ47_01565 [Thermoprotei archaeon]|nr:MAG: hypothetical protein DRJ47_01565 [Thermoprotei archaeon]
MDAEGRCNSRLPDTKLSEQPDRSSSGEKLVKELCEKTSGYILSDETYIDIHFDKKPISIIDVCFDRCALIYSFSKTFAYPSLRLRYVVAPREIVKKIVEFIRATITCVPAFIQKAGVTALDLRKEVAEKTRNIIRARAETFVKHLDKNFFHT